MSAKVSLTPTKMVLTLHHALPATVPWTCHFCANTQGVGSGVHYLDILPVKLYGYMCSRCSELVLVSPLTAREQLERMGFDDLARLHRKRCLVPGIAASFRKLTHPGLISVEL